MNSLSGLISSHISVFLHPARRISSLIKLAYFASGQWYSQMIDNVLKCLALVSLLLLSHTAMASSYEEAFSAYQNQQFGAAESIWNQLATEGDVNAQYALGVMHLRREASDSSPVAAFSWFEKAADQGHSTAMFNLGVAYWEGTGVDQNKSKALGLWQEAALKGDSGAQFNLGLAYYIGEERSADLDQAAKWIGLAADQNHPEAKRILKVIENERTNQDDSDSGTQVAIASTAESSETDTASSATVNTSASAPEPIKNKYWQSIDQQASLFHEPSGIPFGQLAANTPLEVTGQDGGWAKVTVPDGLKTWIYSKFIQVDGDSGVITGESVRVRPSPSTDNSTSPPLGMYPKGEKVRVLQSQGDWVQVRAPKSIGGWLRVEEIEEYNDTSENRDSQWRLARSKGA